jgi:hypothetical protein
MPDPTPFEVNQRAAERAHDAADELGKLLNEAATRDAQGVIRVLLAINGGAAAAMLAFTGGLVARSQLPLTSIAPVTANLKWCASGLVASGTAAVMAYLTNYSYAAAAGYRLRNWEHPYVHPTRKAKGCLYAAYVFHAVGVSAAMIGLGLFVYGLFKVQQKIGLLFRV